MKPNFSLSSSNELELKIPSPSVFKNLRDRPERAFASMTVSVMARSLPVFLDMVKHHLKVDAESLKICPYRDPPSDRAYGPMWSVDIFSPGKNFCFC